MVKHIIIWKLKEEYNNDNIKKNIKENLENLKGQISGLLEIEVAINPLDSSNGDVLLYSVFEDEEALKTYASHEKHLYIANTFVRPYTKERSCMDFVC